LPPIAHNFAARPLVARIRSAWFSVANEPTTAIITDNKTSGIFQEIGKSDSRSND